MTTERKIQALNILMARGLNETFFFMCNTLQNLEDEQVITNAERTLLIRELWVDRIPDIRTNDFIRPRLGAWYASKDQDVRIRNIKYTITRLENTLK